MTVAVQRRAGFWCAAKHKRTTVYQEAIAVRCGGYIIAPFGISDTHPITCPDCLAGRLWTEAAGGAAVHG